GSGWRAASFAARVKPGSVLLGYAPRPVRPPDERRCLRLVSECGRGDASLIPPVGRRWRRCSARVAGVTSGVVEESRRTSALASADEFADHLLEGCTVWHTALGDAGGSAAAATDLGQRRPERGAGVDPGVFGGGEQQRGRLVHRSDEHG